MTNATEKTMTVTLLQFECDGEVLGTGAVWGSSDLVAEGIFCMGRLRDAAIPSELVGRRQMARYRSCTGGVKHGWIQFLGGRFVLSGAEKVREAGSVSLKRKLG